MIRSANSLPLSAFIVEYDQESIVPEPSAVPLLFSGLAFVLMRFRGRRRNA